MKRLRERARPTIGRWVPFALAAGIVLGVHGGALAQTPEEGGEVFDEKCVSCHTVGGGALVGPDLEGAAERLGGTDALAEFILAPDQVRPGTAMPNLGLTENELAALVAFLTPSAALPEAAPPEAAPAEQPPVAAGTGSAAAGKELFEGSDRLAGGGPPCLSCHSIAGIGALGGGQIGPDLTGSFAKYNGAAGLSGVLAQIAFPTMQPVYANQALTEREIADLVAFIEQAPQAERPAGSAGKLVGLAFGAVALLGLVAFAIWHGRLRSVRRTLVNRTTRK